MTIDRHVSVIHMIKMFLSLGIRSDAFSTIGILIMLRKQGIPLCIEVPNLELLDIR